MHGSKAYEIYRIKDAAECLEFCFNIILPSFKLFEAQLPRIPVACVGACLSGRDCGRVEVVHSEGQSHI